MRSRPALRFRLKIRLWRGAMAGPSPSGPAPLEPPRRPVREDFVDDDEAQGLKHHRRHLGRRRRRPEAQGSRRYRSAREWFSAAPRRCEIPPFQRDDVGASSIIAKPPAPAPHHESCGFVAPGRNIVRRSGRLPIGNRCRGQCGRTQKEAEPCPAFDRPADACLRPSA